MARFADLPSVAEIAGGVLSSCNTVFGMPEKEVIFQLAQEENWDEWLPLRVFRPELSLSSVKESDSPVSSMFGEVITYSIDLHMTGVLVQMVLTHVQIISGKREDDSLEVVFEGDEYPGAAYMRRKRRVRITMDNGWHTTFCVVSESTSYEQDWHTPKVFKVTTREGAGPDIIDPPLFHS